MGKNLFIINANTLDEFIAEMFSHPTSIKNTNDFKYSYEYFRKYLKDTFPDFTEVNYPSLKIKNIIICKYKN